jgi:hypothetical protein
MGYEWTRSESQKKEIVLTEAQLRSRRQRSIAIALGVLVLLFFAVTFKGPAVLSWPL